MQARAQFPPQPRSAAEARRWVRDQLTRLGRTDLVSSAEAGVSELVTNCILHAHTSIALRVGDGTGRVVIEVYDAAPMVPKPAGDPGVPDAVDSTIGRGLRIVRAHAQEWGVSTSAQGKAIWFQPTPSGDGRNGAVADDRTRGNGADHGGGASEGRREPPPVPDVDAALDALAEAFPEPEDVTTADAHADMGAAGDDHPVQVRLLGMPPWVVQHHRKRWLELFREMQLVALGDPSPQQSMAQRFCRAAQAVEPDLYQVADLSGGRGYSVTDSGDPVDLVLQVRPSMRPAFVRIRDMARELEREWAGTQLLFVHPGAQAVQLREWWLGQLIDQIDGAEPVPWPGETGVRDEAMTSSSES